MNRVTRLAAFALALVASAVLYAAVFSVVHRPLTLGEIPRLLAAKTAYARTLPSPKTVLFAGSNGRYSHRCEVLAQVMHRPCANLSLAVGIGLDFQLRQVEPLLQPGDLLYLPLEYGQYRVGADEMAAGAQNAVLVHDLRDQLFALPPAEIVRAYAHFDLPFLIQGLAEMALARAGRQRRGEITLLTPQGDQRGHDAAAAAPYREFVRSARFDTTPLPERSHAQDVLAGFLERLRVRGVRVVGGLPSTPDDVPLRAADLDHLQRLYARHGATLLVLPNRSQYPRDCFFDTLVHLNEDCQIRHSRLVGAALKSGVAP